MGVLRKVANREELTLRQVRVFQLAGAIAMVGIFAFLSTQTDVRDPFVIAVFLLCCVGIILALNRYIKKNVAK